MTTIAELEADVAFLLSRAADAGSCSFERGRWTGMSSNALVSLAYGGEQTAFPRDRSDYAACVRTYRRLPKHRRTQEVFEGLASAREAYLERYPEDATAVQRNAERARWEEARRASLSKRRKLRKRP